MTTFVTVEEEGEVEEEEEAIWSDRETVVEGEDGEDEESDTMAVEEPEQQRGRQKVSIPSISKWSTPDKSTYPLRKLYPQSNDMCLKD